MANGFAEGYFGIQVNSSSERRILFSVWSPFATDNPNAIPEDQKIKLLKKGENVYTGEFGHKDSDTLGGIQAPSFFFGKFYSRVRQIGKTGFYDNLWVADAAGNWLELREAKFTGDDIARRGYRKDYAGGSDSGNFFLKNGGFFNQYTELQSMHQRTEGGKKPKIDFGRLR
jgi:hypothetical protein